MVVGKRQGLEVSRQARLPGHAPQPRSFPSDRIQGRGGKLLLRRRIRGSFTTLKRLYQAVGRDAREKSTASMYRLAATSDRVEPITAAPRYPQSSQSSSQPNPIIPALRGPHHAITPTTALRSFSNVLAPRSSHLAGPSKSASADQLLDTYIARLSYADHFNSNGARNNDGGRRVIRQDRANFHKFELGSGRRSPTRCSAGCAQSRRVLETKLANGTRMLPFAP